MRDLIRRLTRRQARTREPLRPAQIRQRRFTVRRHGLDPFEIRAFLNEVADELAVTQTALVAVREENARIRRALHEWQGRQSGRHRYR